MNILFVYNKKAGKKFEPLVVNQITELIPQGIDFFFVDIREFDDYDTTSFDKLVAIGGDGTVNTVAKRANEQNKILAVIPKGSGDGLARFLNIPRNINAAVDIAMNGKVVYIDTAEVDGHFFINVAGAGFEAEVAHKFGAGGIRGLRGYAKTILESFGDRTEKEVTLTLDGVKTTLPFFSLSIANGAQWGNNFEIASAADIQDGLLEVAVMRKPKWLRVIGLIRFLKSKKQENNAFLSYYKASKIDIRRSGKQWHIDGEPVILKNKKYIKIHPRSLKIVVPL